MRRITPPCSLCAQGMQSVAPVIGAAFFVCSDNRKNDQSGGDGGDKVAAVLGAERIGDDESNGGRSGDGDEDATDVHR